jgi:hypothetical protein
MAAAALLMGGFTANLEMVTREVVFIGGLGLVIGFLARSRPVRRYARPTPTLTCGAGSATIAQVRTAIQPGVGIRKESSMGLNAR